MGGPSSKLVITLAALAAGSLTIIWAVLREMSDRFMYINQCSTCPQLRYLMVVWYPGPNDEWITSPLRKWMINSQSIRCAHWDRVSGARYGVINCGRLPARQVLADPNVIWYGKR